MATVADVFQGGATVARRQYRLLAIAGQRHRSVARRAGGLAGFTPHHVRQRWSRSRVLRY